VGVTVDVQRQVMRSNLPPQGRHIVLTLCAIADFKTGVIPDEYSPSLSDLMSMTGLGRNGVICHRDLAETTGWIVIDRPTDAQARRGATCRYQVEVGRDVTAEELAGLKARRAPKAKPDPDGPDVAPADDGPKCPDTAGAATEPASAATAPPETGEDDHPGSAPAPGWCRSGTSAGAGTAPYKEVSLSRQGQTPPTPHDPPATTVPEAETGGGREDQPELETEDDADLAALVAAIRAERPEWTTAAIRAALVEPSVLERPWPIRAVAMRLIAADPQTTAPGRLRAPGPWWAKAAAMVRARDRPATGAGQPPQCGKCGPNRLIDGDDGRLHRCPNCHPLATASKAA
jgi:hypothetical protein